MEEELKKFGLSLNETKVYLSLLNIGKTTVGDIIKNLNFHRQSVYNALEKLEQKEMITRKTIHKVNHYEIADPKILIENAKKKELLANRLSQNIQAKMKITKHKQEINVYENRKQIQKFFINKFNESPKNSTVFVISNYVKKLEDVLGKDFFQEEYEKIRFRRQIYSKNITGKKNKEAFRNIQKKSGKNLRTIKYLPGNLLGPISITIWLDSISFQSFDTDNFIVDIKNRDLRSSYLKHFNGLWKIAK